MCHNLDLMSLQDLLNRIKPKQAVEIVELGDDGLSSTSWTTTLFQKLFLSIIIILVSLLSFGIGRLSIVGKREPIKIEYDPLIVGQVPSSNIKQSAAVINAAVGVVVSKNGSKYHYSHCPGAKQIKEKNKIAFNSPEAAEAAGYTLASNCSLP